MCVTFPMAYTFLMLWHYIDVDAVGFGTVLCIVCRAWCWAVCIYGKYLCQENRGTKCGILQCLHMCLCNVTWNSMVYTTGKIDFCQKIWLIYGYFFLLLWDQTQYTQEEKNNLIRLDLMVFEHMYLRRRQQKNSGRTYYTHVAKYMPPAHKDTKPNFT